MQQWLMTLAHVKWFTGILPGWPAPISEVLTGPFLAGFGLTIVTLLLATWLNVPLQSIGWVQGIHAWLDRWKPYSVWLIRVGVGVPLIAAGLNGYLFHYELVPVPSWVYLAEVVLGVLVLAPHVDRVAGIGIIGLYLYGAVHFHTHPMIDYISWVGACFYLVTRATRAEAAAIPVLYMTTGISLAWAAVEKWVYPQMALDILAHQHIPTFGFPPVAFLTLAGWVELGVAYLLITGVLNRFLSLVVTMLFVLTSVVFGSREILGHWQLHATLLFFLVEGPGKNVTPVLWHRGLRLQLAFVGVTIIPFVAGLIALYYALLGS